MEKFHKRRFVYLLGEGLPPTVIDSQVITVLRRMAQYGVVFDLLVYQTGKPSKAERVSLAKRLERVRRELPGNVRFWLLPTPSLFVRKRKDSQQPTSRSASCDRSKDYGTRFNATVREVALRVRLFILEMLVLTFLAPSICRRQIIIVHARAAAIELGVRLKRWYSGFRLLVDVRGDALAEYLYYTSNHGIPPDSPAVQREYQKLKIVEQQAVQTADVIQCISHMLRLRLESDYGVSPGRIRVVPCLADEEKFYYDVDARARLRAELDVDGRTAFIYSGTIQAWQIPDVIFRLFRQLSDEMDGLYLIVLTPQTDQARSLACKSGLKEGQHVIFRSARYEEVCAYLSAADVGLLLRQPHPLNRVASPTKFAEYVMCGLPVMVSRGVGDTEDIVYNNGLGVILHNYEDTIEVKHKAVTAIQMAHNDQRETRARIAASVLGLNAYLREWAQLYLNL